MTNTTDVQVLRRDGAPSLAWQRRAPQPGRAKLLWLGGFRADMGGTKATFLDGWAAETGRGLTRFDYSGHGRSEGTFEDGTIGQWTHDALAVLDTCTEGPQILVASSMGAWIACHLAQARPERIAGLLLLAAAPDFTEDLMWESFPFHVREAIENEGRWVQTGPEGETVITRALIEDGRAQRVLGAPLPYEGPVRLLHGLADTDVPWTQASRLIDAFTSRDIEMTLIKGANHRLSDPASLARVTALLEALCGRAETTS
ncbi:alpha/beta fold hydrolase [Hyphobacterium marinum]|uniref:Alpha/beta hydrolase n=1 Tax=Hyphobacterium marinum TaxID=3116574 RepID=A0ABU7LUD7_9PROT|nr:alpha/beta hydrolase [Hyphobacterium sp. Y6023]MEE2565162.1 alpha/beta hydrolase [Hyphobacterium sp. Y6023]